MDKQYKLVLFDLDGTLIDTIEDLAEAVNHALAVRHLPLHELAEYRTMVGHGIRDLVTKALPKEQQADDALIDAALTDFKAYYTSHIDVHTHPYPGMVDLLTDLHAADIRLAVVSNKFQAGTEHLIHEFFPAVPFVAILGNRPGFPLKPDPEIISEVLRLAGTTSSETVLVGDSGTDMRTAQKSGIDAIARSETVMVGDSGTDMRTAQNSGIDAIARSETVLVGDSGTDMRTAQNSGIDAIAVGWGYRPMAPSPDYRFAPTVPALRTLLLG